MRNMYYTFNQKYDFHPYTIGDIFPIFMQYNPVQISIDDKVCWDSKYATETCDKALVKFLTKQVSELWISTIDDNHSIIKITTWENGDGT